MLAPRSFFPPQCNVFRDRPARDGANQLGLDQAFEQVQGVHRVFPRAWLHGIADLGHVYAMHGICSSSLLFQQQAQAGPDFYLASQLLPASHAGSITHLAALCRQNSMNPANLVAASPHIWRAKFWNVEPSVLIVMAQPKGLMG